ncbi:hypothetical protein JCM3774_005851 [Rhodotorula dairenensis]
MTLTLALPPSAALNHARPVHRAQLHPVVLATILDSHLRRQPDHDRVLGTLLGPKQPAHGQAGTVHVTEAFAVPYAVRHRGQVTIDVEHHRAVLDLHLKLNPKLQVVGWFATDPNLNSFSALIHNFYQNESPGQQALHLALDPESLQFRVWTAQPLGSAAGLAFTPVEHSVHVQPHDRPSLDLLSSRVSSLSQLVSAAAAADQDQDQDRDREDLEVPTPLDALYTLLNQVTVMLDQVLDYVKQVAQGQIPPNEKVGRALLETVGSVPVASPAPAATPTAPAAEDNKEENDAATKTKATATGSTSLVDFEEEFNAHLADVLMVSYLANVIKTQAELSSRLNLLV